jgi:thiamine-monophosphate kinase
VREEDIIDLFYPDTAADLDDCARVEDDRIVTTDALVEGTHFRLDWSSPEDLAVKLWAVNLSDIAASGGEPDWCVLSLGLPPTIEPDFLRRFAAALRAELRRDDCRLVGGDTFRAPVLLLSLTLSGRLERSPREPPRYLGRQGARPGDSLYVSGEPGLSQLGYLYLAGERPPPADPEQDPQYLAAVHRHRRPEARLAWARILRRHSEVHAMMDVSDGLYPDLQRLAAASRSLLEIDWRRLPLPAVARERVAAHPQSSDDLTDAQWRELALTSGEELELLFAATPGLTFEFPCTEIGRVVAADASDPGIRLNGAPWPVPPRWFQHF